MFNIPEIPFDIVEIDASAIDVSPQSLAKIKPYTWEETLAITQTMFDSLIVEKSLPAYLEWRKEYLARVAANTIRTYDKEMLVEFFVDEGITHPTCPDAKLFGQTTWDHEKLHQEAWKKAGIDSYIGIHMFAGNMFGGVCIENYDDLVKRFGKNYKDFVAVFGQVLIAPSLAGLDYDEETNMGYKLIAASK